jgi:protein-S-isoprenylcysteine O-methyltransferase Ste14
MTKTIALIVWALGIVAWYVIRYPFQRRSRKAAVKTSLVDRTEWTLLAVLTVGFFLLPAIYAATGIPQRFDRAFVPLLAWLGVPTLILSLWLFSRSNADLGRNWSASLKVREGHQLVTGGVYRYVRHPMYSSFLLLGIAQFLLVPNWLAGTSGLAGTVLLVLLRLRREEAMMLDQFGDPYRDYCERTPRIIPWLL